MIKSIPFRPYSIATILIINRTKHNIFVECSCCKRLYFTFYSSRLNMSFESVRRRMYAFKMLAIGGELYFSNCLEISCQRGIYTYGNVKSAGTPRLQRCCNSD